jgi:hypothetical protein
MQTIVESPVGLHASVSAQIANIPIHSFRNDPSGQEKLARARLKHQNETFRLIKSELSTLELSPTTVPSNGILSAVAILSLYGLSRTTSLQQAHPLSPLATAQNLHIYGRMNLVPQHIAGLHLLVKQKGGVGTIENHSLVDLIKSVDLNSASRNLTAPGLMWEDPREVSSFLSQRSYSPDGPALASSAILSSGFPKLPQLTLSALHILTRTTIGLDHYHRRAPGSPTLATLVQSRNSAQHRLLSLPHNPHPTNDSEAIAEICRLTMLIYSDMALLPFPPESQVKPRLARLLLDQLLRWTQWEGVEVEFLAWAVVLGGVAAFSTGMRGDFVRLMWESRIVARSGSWDVLHEKLRTFLWWDFVCEKSGMTFWDESLAMGGSSQSRDLVIIHRTLGS